MKRYLKRILFALLAVTIWGGGSYAQDVFDFGIYDYANNTQASSLNWQAANCSLTFVDEGQNEAVFHSGQIRFYSRNGLTITANDASAAIASVVFEWDDRYTPAEGKIVPTVGGYDYKSHTWTGQSNSVTFTNTNTSQYRIKKITVIVSGELKTPCTVTFGEQTDGQTFTVVEGDEASFQSPTATLYPAEAGAVAYESDNSSVASVDVATGEVTFGPEFGTATITASFAGNDTYAASSASYTIVYKKDMSGTAFYESFDTNSGFGGNDGEWGGISGGPTPSADNEGWEFNSGFGASQCVRFGTANYSGYATTPALNLSGDATLTFKAAAWDAGNEKTTLALGISGGGSLSGTSVEMEKGAWKEYTISITGGTPNTKITFSSPEEKNNRFFLDEVSVYASGGGSAAVAMPTISLPSGFYVDPQTVEIAAAEGCTIRYTFDGTSPNSGSTLYEGPIAISETTTLRAIAINAEGIYSNSTRMDYEFPVACDDIAAVKQQVDGKIVRVTLKDAQVVYVNSYGDNTEYYLRDASGAIDLYNIGLDLSAGQVLSGTLVAEYKFFNFVEELVRTEYTNADDLTITDGDTPAPAATSIADINSGKYTCDLVAISGATVTKEGSNSYVGDGNGTVQIYNKFQIPDYTEPFAGANIDIVGICIKYRDAYEILPIANAITYNFSETADNATGDVAAANVKLERTLSSDYWNTLCLPFGMTAEQVEATFGAGTKITEFNGTVEGTTMMFDNATAIEAGKPYLIKPALTTANPTIEGVTLSSAGPATIASAKVSGYAFVGTYSPATIKADGTDLFISTDGSVKKPSSADGTANRIKGMRAYISIPVGTDAKMVKLSFDGSLMGIEDIDSFGNVDDGRIYSLGGQYVGDNADSLPKGIYIKNGKKITIK